MPFVIYLPKFPCFDAAGSLLGMSQWGPMGRGAGYHSRRSRFQVARNSGAGVRGRHSVRNASDFEPLCGDRLEEFAVNVERLERCHRHRGKLPRPGLDHRGRDLPRGLHPDQAHEVRELDRLILRDLIDEQRQMTVRAGDSLPSTPHRSLELSSRLWKGQKWPSQDQGVVTGRLAVGRPSSVSNELTARSAVLVKVKVPSNSSTSSQ